MAIIPCPECSNQISDKAEICPHCGYRLQKEIHININPTKESGFDKFNKDLKGCADDSFRIGCGLTLLMILLGLLLILLL